MAKKDKTANYFGFKENGGVLVINLLNRTNLFTCRDSRKDKKIFIHKKEFKFGNYHISISGRYLNMKDYLLYVFILRKWYIKNERAVNYSEYVEIDFSEIAELLSKKSTYLKNSPMKAYESIHKSLERLMGVLVTIHDSDLKETDFNHLLSDGTKLSQTSEKLIAEVSKEVERQLDKLPRKEIASKAIANSKSIFVENEKIALELINEYGPEHFIVCTSDNDFYVDNIENAGSVFIGNYTPESAGDYASGTNHTLPTNGFSKSYSGVNLDSFTKSITFQKISKEGIKTIGNAIELMAEAEGLQAHKNAVSIRLKDL